MMRLALVLALIAAIYGQAVPTTFRVRGMVTDSTTDQPIPNVRVQVIGGGSALTSASGTYEIPLAAVGSYDVKIEAQGYRPEYEFYNAVLEAPYDTATVHMQMYRPGSITGRLIDAETRQPIAGIRVSVSRVRYVVGRTLLAAAGGGATDAGGNFRIEQLRAGPYALGFAASIAEQVLNSDTPPTQERAVGYRRQRWPTGENTLELRGGSALDLGDILLAQEPLYRITGVLTGCPNGDDLSRGMILLQRNGGSLLNVSGSIAPVACGERFRIENLAPGEYVLQLNVERVGATTMGIVPVVDRDVEYNPVFSLPLTIRGSLVVPEGFPGLERTQISLLASRGTTAPSVFAQVTGDGKFELTQVTGGSLEVVVTPLPAPYYVAEILYNGAPLRDSSLEVNSYSVVRELKIRIAGDGARVSGSVRKNGDIAPDSSVILVAWPERSANGFPVHYLEEAQDGRFRFDRVPPGSYRAIAVEKEAWDRELQKPGGLRGLLSSATQVDLAPNSSRELTLELRWIQLSQ